MTDLQAYRRDKLAHCLRLATMGTENAIEAADWYEANEPWLLGPVEGRKSLGEKVREELSPKETK